MKLNRILAAAFFGAALLAGSVADACTNFLFTKGATKDGSTMITYAADSHTLYGELYYRKAADYPAGTMFMLVDWDSGRQLFEIPQVAHTYSVVGNINEYQLAIGETTYGGREECWKEPVKGIDYGSLIYVTLQRAKNAREAIWWMTKLVADYGYCSEGESFSIADPDEVWILELIGKRSTPVQADLAKKLKYKYTDGAVWVARRIPDGYVSGHANQARITRFPQEGKRFSKAKGKGLHSTISSAHMSYLYEPEVECIYSAEVVTYARACGWFDGKDEDFSFADTYAPLTFSAMRGCDARVYAMFRRVASGMERYEKYAMGDATAERLPLWIKPDHKIDVLEAMALMRDHYEGTSMDMSKDLGAGPFNCPYRWRPMGFELDGHTYVHERATSTQQTGFSFVAQCRGWLPSKIGGILWFGVDDTYSTVYCPMYCGITEIPLCFREGNGDMVTYSETSAFWLFNRVSNFLYSRYSDMIKDVQGVQNSLEKHYAEAVHKFDKRAAQNEGEALERLLNDFSNRQAEEMMLEWNNLDRYLLVKYMDGNIKKEKNGSFERTATGQAAFPLQPHYREAWQRMIVNDHGDVIREK
ncbi:MAG: peptidase U34 [bacterium P3]|nr:MAG: peptidase U34 [bacterium P3]KWW40050.1 MAG: peptidase U34 [bacterium F083]